MQYFTKTLTIDFWEAVFIIGQSLEINEPTLRQWKSRGYIPPARHHEFVQQAKVCGVALTHDDLYDIFSKVKKEDN